MTTNKLKFVLILFLIAFACCQQDPDHAGETEEEHADHADQQSSNLISVSQRWGFGFLAGLGVSVIGFVTALIIVSCKKVASDNCFQMTIKFLFSLAFGALLGDAMIHLLPAGYSGDGVDFRVTAGIFIGSIVFFILLERVFAACGITHKHWHGDECHDDHQGAIDNHDHPRKVANQDQNQQENNTNTIKVKSVRQSQTALNDNINQKKQHKCKNHHDHDHNHNHEHNHNHNHSSDIQQTSRGNDSDQGKSCWENLKGKGTAGYMNLLGSLIHNFMDGLALGVAFATGDSKVFVPILVAIITHEIPREMGDVAILMTNQFSSKQTILCNGFVNLTSLIGVFIGLAITDLDEVAKTYILIFVAGNFIFIAADIWQNLFKNRGFAKNFIQFTGFGVGIAAMYLILLLESDAEGHDH